MKDAALGGKMLPAVGSKIEGIASASSFRALWYTVSGFAWIRQYSPETI